MFEGYKVVFVEDDLPVRVSLTQTLELEGLTVLPCRSAEEALPHLQPGAQVILISDVRLPGMDGRALLAHVQATLTPGFVLTWSDWQAWTKLAWIPIGGVCIAISLTALVRQAYERSGSLALPAVLLGSYLAHHLTGTASIWGFLFQSQDPRIDGGFGIISVLAWGLLACYPGAIIGAKMDVDTLPVQDHAAA